MSGVNLCLEKAVLACMKMLSRHLPDESQDKPQLEYPASNHGIKVRCLPNAGAERYRDTSLLGVHT
jgi:hypothetical protein